jgi:hypothetical protein
MKLADPTTDSRLDRQQISSHVRGGPPTEITLGSAGLVLLSALPA